MFVGAHPDDESFGPGGTLTEYAAQGVRVLYACATRGEAGTVDPAHLKGYATLGDQRWAELMCAAQALRLSSVRHLGYRDSGMQGDPDHQHPQALVGAPLEAVTRTIVAAIRDVRPQVVITFATRNAPYNRQSSFQEERRKAGGKKSAPRPPTAAHPRSARAMVSLPCQATNAAWSDDAARTAGTLRSYRLIAGKVPQMELLLYSYAYGKPVERHEVTASARPAGPEGSEPKGSAARYHSPWRSA
jgi:hypothetical protein